MESGIYRVEMDGRWNLKDLYEFPHAYLQVYAFIYAFDTDLPTRDEERINHALESYPWAGGYSIVNMYSVLQSQVSPRFKPVVKEIRYASPGWIDLLLNVHPAVQIAGAVTAIATSTAGAVKAYAAIQDCLYKISARARKARIEKIQLTRQEVKELEGLNKDLADSMNFNRLSELQDRTGSVHVTSKLLSAQYRRLKKLAEFVTSGKARLPVSTPKAAPKTTPKKKKKKSHKG
ncbi:hypothetical protein [Thermomonas carbonis]|uniref:Uncharacterized protein n=2 Tax=Thermomonas carbonis TaxID=1463158 RepID=A0A7G9SNC1_9GAMM|nr:hypothetical protein [Thermomonas carbonis]QNN69346.1 hypothetical protein H9L16_11760 [Thermomonas carbonis]